jgi:predicted MFS family arabinose efflux permease
MYLIDLSTDLNRARTNAPATAAFNAGLAVGPAMGGVLLDQVGISYAYFTVGGLFAALTMLTQVIIKETRAMHVETSKQQSQLKDAFSVTFKKWGQLFKLRDVRNLVLLNTFFWGCLGGIQMTMLPMLMLQPQLNLDVSQISASFAIISITSFLLAQPIAYVSDRFDKIGVSCAGALMIVGASMFIPHSMSFMELASALVPLSVGSTIMQSAPSSHMANVVPPGDKAQALSLLRTGGDIGMLCGASAAGIVAAMTSVQSMIMLDGGVLGICTAAVAASHFINRPRQSRKQR